MAEITFEKLALALESVRGTAESDPTHYANLMGTLAFGHEYYRPEESRGELEENYREKRTREWGILEAEGGLDPDLLPVFLEMIVKGGVTPTQPGATVGTHLWDYKQSLSTDDIKAASIWFGDGNVQEFRGAFGCLESLSIEADASGTEGPSLSVSGMTQQPEKVASPTYPAQTVGELLTSVEMQAWIDNLDGDITSIDDAGVNELVGKVVSASVELPSGVIPKYLGKGPGADLSYSKIGRGKRALTSGIVVEFDDTTEIDHYLNEDYVRLRLRFNGPLIENDGSDDYFYYVEVDAIGQLKYEDWGELEGINRTVEFSVNTTKRIDGEPSWAIRVQNEQASL